MDDDDDDDENHLYKSAELFCKEKTPSDLLMDPKHLQHHVVTTMMMMMMMIMVMKRVLI